MKKRYGKFYFGYCIITLLILINFLFLNHSPLSAQTVDKFIPGSNEFYSVHTGTNDEFGRAVAVSRNYAIIGAPVQGGAFIFEFNGQTWGERHHFQHNDASSYYGIAVDIDGNTAVVGAYLEDVGGRVDAGAAYVYQLENDTWVNKAKLQASTGHIGNSYAFGYSVAIDGNTIAVGAVQDGYPTWTGAVYVFERPLNGWAGTVNEKARLRASDRASGDILGCSVAIHGDIIVTGARQDDGNQGAAYIFERPGGGWVDRDQETVKLIKAHRVSGDGLGQCVALQGNIIVVGAHEDRDQNRGGAAYVFYRPEGGWPVNQPTDTEDITLTAGDVSYLNRFACSIAIDGNTIVVGANHDDNINSTNAGSAYIFQNNGTSWIRKAEIFAEGGSPADFFGTDVDIDNNTILISAVSGDRPPPDPVNTGTVYAINLTPATPTGFAATDEQSESNTITLTWQFPANNSAYFPPDSFALYIDNETNPVTITNTDIRSYLHSTLPGEVHGYQLTARNLFGGSGLVNDVGRRIPDGIISGKISAGSSIGPPVPDIDVSIEPNGNSLNFNPSPDFFPHVLVDPMVSFPTDSFTISFWLKTQDANWSYIISYATEYSLNNILIGNPKGLFVEIHGTQMITGRAVNDGQWHHVALTRDVSGWYQFYVDGQLAGGTMQINDEIRPEGVLVFGQEQDAFGGGFEYSQAYTGQLDEVQIWNTKLTAEQIQDYMYRCLDGHESNLSAYWRFDASQGNGVYDFCRNQSTNHSPGFNVGASISAENAPVQKINTSIAQYINDNYNYIFDRVYYGGSHYFSVIPDTTGRHVFDNNSRQAFLTTEDEDGYKATINFIDNSQYTLDGQITMSGTSCGIQGVAIKDMTQGGMILGYTEADGSFSLSLRSGDHTLVPEYYQHTFVPAQMAVSITSSGHTPVNFEDMTRYTISGTVGGGRSKFFLGRTTLEISGPNGCTEATLATDDGQYSFELPALPALTLEVTNIDLPAGEWEMIQTGNLGSMVTQKQISLARGDTIVDFIYYAEPEIVISGWPVSNCNFPVMEQGLVYPIIIDVIERYGANTCVSDSGEIRIYNGISDEGIPHEAILDTTGRYNYAFRAGEPNFTSFGNRPYQKNLQVFVQTRGGTVFETKWTVVTGYSPREQTFVTVSPELPLLILRDPPGDNSYSEMKQTLATSVTTSLGILTDASIGTYATAKAGVQFESGFLGFSMETKFWGSVSSSIEVGASLLNQTEQQIYISSSTGFRTSGNEDITGAEGDVFMGAAFNLLYAITDELSINDRCEVETSKSIVYGVDSLKSTYLYTDKYIRNFLIPDLQLLKDMSTNLDDIQRYSDQVEVWQQTLAFNDSLKKTAVPIEDPSFNFEYVTFSGDIIAEYQTTVTQVESRSIYFNMYLNSQVATEAGLEIAGSGFQAGVQVRASLNIGKAKSASTITTNEIGFHLHDNDDGDLFLVKIMGDPVYGTPVYEVLGGKSSSPWEEHTQKRDKVGLLSDSYVQTDLPPQQVAGFNLNITNLSESFEARTYEAVILNETNPDGAVISIAGVPVIVPVSFNFEANETKNIVMTFERGPFAYDYENIQVVVRAPGDHSIADTAAYSAHFQSPCSPITLTKPGPSWVVNRDSHDSLRIVFGGYDKTKMSGVYLQYSQMGRNAWYDGLHILVQDLPDNNAAFYWQTDSLQDGLYDLRLAVQWNQDIAYTSNISGRIDRLSPQPFGDPQPADGVLARGDEISIVFNEHIAENSVTADKISLLNTTNATAIPCTYSCLENKIIITPDVSDSELENQTLQATVKGISDLYGNTMPGGVSWSFYVNKNPVYWNPLFVERSVLQNSIDSLYVKINNIGQTDASVTITDAPVWTQLDFSSGTVYANGSVSILVQISTQQLDLGTHIDTIFAQTPQGVEPLVIQINVMTEAPVWAVDPASFQYTMTLTGAVFIEDVPFSDVHDRLAAFVGNDVRGVVEVQQIVPQDFYVAFLTIYSNQVSNEQVTLCIWDASEGQIRNINEVYTFVTDTIYGTAAVFEQLHVSDILLQQIALTDRWTWISLGVEAKDMSTRTILKHLQASDGDLIKGSTSYSQYLPGVGWVGTLDTMHTGAGFKVKKSQPDKLDFFGVQVPLDDHPIGIVPGWNWIAYLPGQTMAVNDALSLFAAAAGDLIKNKTEQASFSSTQWSGSLTQMIPGMGYMLNSTNAGELRYPGASGKRVNNNTIVSAKDYHIEAPAWTVNPNAFEHSMNITGNLTVDGILNADENVLMAAFVDGDCRGVTHPLSVQNKWLYFLTVYADPGATVSFKIWDAVSDQIADLTQTIIFSPDSLIGSPSRPSAWNTPVSSIADNEQNIPTRYELAQNHPNPFNPTTTIKYALKHSGHVNLTIYDILGRVVRVLVNDEQKTGYYNLEFDSAGLASGAYFYQLQTENFQDVKKMILLK